MKNKKWPTQARLHELFYYESGTGRLMRHLAMQGCQLETEAGTLTCQGYRRVCVDGGKYLTHVLIWIWVHGRPPKQQIDHINGVRNDNRISNIRECIHQENMRWARQRAQCGVYHTGRQTTKPWRTRIEVNGKQYHIGVYATRAEARVARVAAERQYWGLEEAGDPNELR